MDHIVKVVFLFILFVFSWLYQEQSYQWDITQTIMKNADNLSTHDALLQPLKDELTEGRVIFDPDIARSVFERTLKMNLGLDNALKPFVGSPMRAKVEVIEFRILDDSNTTFPFLFEDTRFNVVKWLNGPAIFAVIQTDYPKLINVFGTGNEIRVPSIQEYKPDM